MEIEKNLIRCLPGSDRLWSEMTDSGPIFLILFVLRPYVITKHFFFFDDPTQKKTMSQVLRICPRVW